MQTLRFWRAFVQPNHEYLVISQIGDREAKVGLGVPISYIEHFLISVKFADLN